MTDVEEQLQSMVEAMPTAVVVVDQRGKIVLVNAEAVKLFGYTQDELVGRSVEFLVPERLRDKHYNFRAGFLAEPSARPMGAGRDLYARRKDGTEVPVEIGLNPIETEKGLLTLSAIVNLTERKRLEGALRLLERVAVAANEATVIGDAMQACLDEVCAYTGWPVGHVYVRAEDGRDELVSTKLWHLDYPARFEAFRRISEEARFARGVGLPGRVLAESKPAWIADVAEDAGFPLARPAEDIGVKGGFAFPVLAGTEVAAVLTFFAEAAAQPDAELVKLMAHVGTQLGRVIERQRASEEIQRMRSSLKSVLDAMPSVLVAVDAEGHVTAWNKSAEQAAGLPSAAVAGRDFQELLPALRSQADKVAEAIRQRRPVRTELLATEAQGEPQYADILVYPLFTNGTAGAVIRIDDITQRIRFEQTMVQNEKMLSLGGLAAGMAHEINNPLSAVLQNCQNIQRRVVADLPANQRVARDLGIDLNEVQSYLRRRGILRFVEDIREAAGRARRIVSDMLVFSRRSAPERLPADVAEMLETALRMAATDYDLKKHCGFKQIEVVRDYDAEPEPLYCDRAAIEQVFLNLIKNAAHAMAQSTTLPHRLTLRSGREGGYVCIEIEDNGPGMDATTRRRVFEPFFTTKAPGVGTGLGLSVSYSIIAEQHGGDIQVMSTPDKGTCFVIRLPLRAAGRDSSRGTK